ncbi:MAG: hypothetical protein JXB26_19530 [Candidatus Aminicenantes bacterium]|nr:hypothetical protein [Candidatus Aminicenantes bacterium]
MAIKSFRNAFLIILFLFIVGILGTAEEKAVESQLAVTPVTIDGAGTEWQPDEFITQEKPAVSYSFRNDGKNMYVYFVFNDRKAQSSVMATGLKVWLNVEGKTKKAYGYRFIQKQISADEMIAQMEKKGSKLTGEKINEIKKSSSYIFFQSDVIDKKGNPKTEEAITGEVTPPLFKAKPTQKKTMAFELKIPLKGLIHLKNGGELIPGKAVMVGFEWGGMTPEMRKQLMARRAARGSRASASGMSSDPTTESNVRARTTEMTANSASPLAGNPPKHAFWLDVTLAAEK